MEGEVPNTKMGSKKVSPLAKTNFKSVSKTGMVKPNDEILYEEEMFDASPLSRRRTKKCSKAEIENYLKDSNIKIVDKVIVNNEDGAPELYMVKGYTILGQPVFIEMDQLKNPTGINRTDLTMIEVQKASVIPTSTKNGQLKSVERGVVIECDNGVCVLTKTPTGEKEERNFIYVQKPSVRAGILGDNPLGAPITRSTEWLANPEQCLVSVNKETVEIRKSAHKESMDQFAKAKRALAEIAAEFDKFAKCMDEKMEATIRVLQELEGIQKEWLALPMCQENFKKMEIIRDKLIKYNDLISDQLKSVMIVGAETQKLEKIAARMVEVREYVCENYTECQTVIKEI